jgi:dipeptidase
MKITRFLSLAASVSLTLAILCLEPVDTTEACTAAIAGKNTTVDGSILFAKTEDDLPHDVDYLWWVEGQTFAEGETVPLQAGGSLPQVTETYAYLWDQCPRTSFSNHLVNEWGVAFGSNGCSSKEDSVEEVQARGDIKDGGLGFMLRFILAQRAKTAREAVEIAAALLDEYGYNASGRNLNIVDPNEAWQLQMVRGKQYVARRVQDDEVALIANTFSIRRVDCRDQQNFLCSPRLIEYAIERGWYDPSTDGEFDFARAYAPDEDHRGPVNTRRHWLMAKTLNREFPLTWKDADEGRMPVSVIPDGKISLSDVTSLMRSHFEGTDLDTSNGYSTSPHRVSSRPICTYWTHRTTVVQQRGWLPVDIGTVIWRALGQPCSSVFVPWYLGAREIPEELRRAPENLATTDRSLLEFQFDPPRSDSIIDRSSASNVFGVLGGLVDANYQAVHRHVKSRWSEMEQRMLELQPAVDAVAVEIHSRDPEMARTYLAQQNRVLLIDSLSVAEELIDLLEWNLWGTGLGKEILLPVAVSPAVLTRYVGAYQVKDGPLFCISVAGRTLSLEVQGLATFDLSALSNKEFFIPDSDIRLRFVGDESGAISEVVLRKSGRDAIAKPVATAGCAAPK